MKSLLSLIIQTIVIAFLLLTTFIQVDAQSQCLDWARGFGSTFFNSANSVAVDDSGNVLTTGVFRGTVDFDPGNGVYNLTSWGNENDIFVQKLDSAGNFLWVYQTGGSGFDGGTDIAVDSSGNVYYTGFNGLTNSNAILIEKLGPSGNLIWSKTVGGSIWDNSPYLALDSAGSVYVTGAFGNTSDFDPGTGIALLSSSGFGDCFVLKLDSAGNYVWARNTGRGNSTVSGTSITVAPSGNIYLSGTFNSTVDFDPGNNTFNLASPFSTGTFIQKLDTSGNLIWVNGISGPSNDIANEITLDQQENAYITGSFQDSVDFDPGPGITNLYAKGSKDLFVTKLDFAGNFIWASQSGGIGGFAEGNAIVINPSDTNIYVTGHYLGTIDFDPGPDTFPLVPNGNSDIFIQRLNSSGNFVSAKGMGGISSDVGFGIAVDGQNHLYTTGRFSFTADFNTGLGVFNLTAISNSADVFVQKSGTDLLCDCIGTDTVSAFDCNSYTWTENGQTYTSSGFYADTTIHSTSCDSIHYLDLTLNSSTPLVTTDTACNSYLWAATGQTITNSGVYYDSLTNVNGCDSVQILNLTLLNTSFGADTIVACDSFTWPTNALSYSVSGVYQDTLINTQGCDSIASLLLTILQSSTSTTTIAACDSFFWPQNGTTYLQSGVHQDTMANAQGCDSILLLDLTINNSSISTDTVVACNSYTWPENGQTYLTSGNYLDTLTSSFGCDSILSIQLTVNTVDASATKLNDTSIIANNLLANAFQWLDCSDNFNPILGETAALFNLPAPGIYAVEVSQNNCVDTSQCIDITTGIGESQRSHLVKVYPNPTTTELTIELDRTYPFIQAVIVDITGRPVYQQQFEHQSRLNLNLMLESGSYFLDIQTSNTRIGFQKISVVR